MVDLSKITAQSSDDHCKQVAMLSSRFLGLLVAIFVLSGCTRPVAQMLRLKAENECKKGDYKTAITDCDHALIVDRNLISAYYTRGFAKLKLNDCDGARRDFDTETKLAPFDAKGYFGRGLVERVKQQRDDALADFEEAIRRNENFLPAYAQRGAMRQEKGDLKGAIQDYDHYLTIFPNDSNIIRSRAFAKYGLSEYGTALTDLDQAIRLDPKNALSYVGRGWIRYIEKRDGEAVSDFTRAIKIDPKQLYSYVDRAIVRAETGDFEGAMVDMRRVIAEEPKSSDNYVERALLEYCHGEYKAALEDCLRAVQMNPGFGANPKYGPFLLWIASIEAHESASTSPKLSEILGSAPQPDWNAKIAAFFSGQLSEQDLLTSATSADSETNRKRHCQAWCYAGLRRLIDGEKISAIDDFEKSIDTSEDTLMEYILSRQQLSSFDRH